MRRICQVSMMALAVLSAAGVARAADAPIPVVQSAPGAQIPNGWVWQGVWQDGRWSGQWVPGPGVAAGMASPSMMLPPNMMPPQGQPMMPPPGMDCGRHHHEAHDCGTPPPMPYAPMGYGPMMGPMMMGWTWVPVQTQPAAPCVETRTTTVTYEYDHHRRRMIPPRPHHHDKRVYTGS